MRKSIGIAALLALAACGRGEEQVAQEEMQTFDVAEEPVPEFSRSARAPAAPGIAPTAAPGVAFNYRYAFRLPAEHIAAVQERHAAACEELGIDRCRITGMRYRLVNDRDIQGMLAFKLDPAIARQFGRQGIETVEQAEGMLVDAEISGEDVGSRIEAGARSLVQMREDLERIEAQLARGGLSSSERTALQAQAERLRSSIRAAEAGQEQRRDQLATTPMVFHYGSGDLAPGFDDETIGEALERAWENVLGGVKLLLVLVITLLPWLLFALALFLIARAINKRINRAPGAATEPAPPVSED